MKNKRKYALKICWFSIIFVVCGANAASTTLICNNMGHPIYIAPYISNCSYEYASVYAFTNESNFLPNDSNGPTGCYSVPTPSSSTQYCVFTYGSEPVSASTGMYALSSSGQSNGSVIVIGATPGTFLVTPQDGNQALAQKN